MSGITIGQAAAFAGVTTRTVRWYHQHGLIAEPPRDASGYRRYDSSDLLRLVQVRTLAEAGVPLARIGDILSSDPARFEKQLDVVEQALSDRIAELTERRDTLRRLAAGNRVLLPERATAILDRMPSWGFAAAEIAMAYEAMVLVRAVAPEYFDAYLSQIELTAEHPRYLAMIKKSFEAENWAPDDPRIDELATDLVSYYLSHPELQPVPSGSSPDAVQLNLLAHHRQEDSPAWARLTTILHAKLREAGFDVPPDNG